ISCGIVADVIFELTSVVRLANVYFADGKPKTIPDIRGGLCSWGRTIVHQDTHKLDRHRATAKANGYIATRAVGYHSVRKRSPVIVSVDMQMHRVVSGAILNLKLSGIGRSAVNMG